MARRPDPRHHVPAHPRGRPPPVLRRSLRQAATPAGRPALPGTRARRHAPGQRRGHPRCAARGCGRQRRATPVRCRREPPLPHLDVGADRARGSGLGTLGSDLPAADEHPAGSGSGRLARLVERRRDDRGLRALGGQRPHPVHRRCRGCRPYGDLPCPGAAVGRGGRTPRAGPGSGPRGRGRGGGQSERRGGREQPRIASGGGRPRGRGRHAGRGDTHRGGSRRRRPHRRGDARRTERGNHRAPPGARRRQRRPPAP